MLRLVSFIISFIAVFAAAPATALMPTAASARGAEVAATEGAAKMLSPGIAVVASAERMAVAARSGAEAVFQAADFEAAAGVSAVDYITLTKLPDSEDGRLMIGSLALAEGQSVTRLNLSRMSLVPAGADVREAGFSFNVNGAAHEYSCTVNFIDGKNSAPTLDTATAASLGASTYSGMPCAGRLAAYDPDGDEMFFSLVSYPRHGSVIMTDRAGGCYVYIPDSGFSGRDSFSYTVRDKWGERADDAATVSVTVSRRASGEGFADMEGSVFESTALRVSAAGIMGGTEVGGKNYFYPSQTVSRSEFLVMAMTAAGIKDLPACDVTVFADDGDIPASAKPYIGAAYTLGVCDGWIKDGKQCFLPDEPITVAEAAMLSAGLLEIRTDGAAEAWADSDGVPAWAASGFGTMRAAGFVGAGFGGSARSKLDRERCAELLAAIMRYAASGKK